MKKITHKLTFNMATFLIVLTLCLLNAICIVKAEEPATNSENYTITGQIDFSGTTSGSENYSIYGFLTDINDVSGNSNTSKQGVNNTKISKNPIIALGEKITKNIDLFLTNIKEAVKNNEVKSLFFGVTNVAGVLGLVGLLAPALLNLPWLSIGSEFLLLFGWARSRKKWGIVYDAESNTPLPLVSVRLFDYENHKLLKTELTDKEGRFGFVVDIGKYYIQPIKKNYNFPSDIVYRDYHREIIDVNNKDQILNINIPMDPNTNELGRRLNIVSGVMDFLGFIRVPVLIIGTILSVAFMSTYPTLINYSVVTMYLILWAIEIYHLRRIKTYGKVLDIDDSSPIPQTIIRILTENDRKLIATRVSDMDGKYFHFVEPGNYTIVATKIDYDQYKISDLSFKRGDILARDILLKKRYKNEKID